MSNDNQKLSHIVYTGERALQEKWDLTRIPGPLAAYYKARSSDKSVEEAMQIALAFGAFDDSVEAAKLLQYQAQMTDNRKEERPTFAFDKMYYFKGFTGIEAMWNAGYTNPRILWAFYKRHSYSVTQMAKELQITD